MSTTSIRPLRADAERNRRRVLDAAAEAFAERGTDVSVTEIARRAGVGQGTVFRHFATKDALVAAIVLERMGEIRSAAQALLDGEDDTDLVARFMRDFAQRHRRDRALAEAVGVDVLASPEVQAAQGQLHETLEALVARGQASGEVRDDIGAIDVLMLTKAIFAAGDSVCAVAPDAWERFADLARDALSPQGARPLAPGISFEALLGGLGAAQASSP